jgi:hypothetical protein
MDELAVMWISPMPMLKANSTYCRYSHPTFCPPVLVTPAYVKPGLSDFPPCAPRLWLVIRLFLPHQFSCIQVAPSV